MTDKQVIDGVDVSGCEHYFNKGCLISRKSLGVFCLNNPNCYYKQLQRAKDECIRLGNERTSDLVQQLQRKTAEREELKNKLQIATEALENFQKEISLIYKFGAVSNNDGIKELFYKNKQALEQIESEE